LKGNSTLDVPSHPTIDIISQYKRISSSYISTDDTDSNIYSNNVERVETEPRIEKPIAFKILNASKNRKICPTVAISSIVSTITNTIESTLKLFKRYMVLMSVGEEIPKILRQKYLVHYKRMTRKLKKIKHVDSLNDHIDQSYFNKERTICNKIREKFFNFKEIETARGLSYTLD